MNESSTINAATKVTGDVTVATTKVLTASSALTALGNVTVNGTGSIAGASSLTFGGAADQTFTMGSTGSVTNLTIAQTADAKVNALGGNLTITGTLALTRGLLVIASPNVVNLTGGFTRGGAYASHVVGLINKNVPAGALGIGRYEFPVGSLTDYRPAAFTFASAPIFTFNLTVSHVAASPDGTGGLPIANGVAAGVDIAGYAPFYWLIKSDVNLGTAVAFNLELTAGGFNYTQGPITDLRIIRRVDGSTVNNPWSLQGSLYDNFANIGVPTVTNINSIGGINPAGARFTYGLKSTLFVANKPADKAVNVGEELKVKLTSPALFGGNQGTLTFTANSSNTAIATATVVGGDTLVVTPIAKGAAVISVNAVDVNAATISTNFNLTVSTVVVLRQIAGKVTYDNAASTVLKDVKVTLNPGNVTVNTDATGNYSFANVADGAYTVTLSSTAPTGGINATDALNTALYFTGQKTLSALRIAAADVNNDGRVNSTDALLIARKSVQLDSSFAKGNWTFTSGSVTVAGANVTADLKGICVGDVDASYTPAGSLAKASLTSNGSIKVNPGAMISVPVSVDAENLAAVSLKIKYAKDLGTFVGVSSKLNGLLSADDNGVVSIAWADLSCKAAVNAAGEESILTLNFKPTENFKAGKSFNVELKEGELATADGKVIANALLKTSSVDAVVPSEFALRQNFPNPFNPTTTIQYDLPVSSKVNLVVFNTLGQVVAQLVNGVQEAGTQKVQFNAQNLTSGVYIYKISVSNGDQKFTQSYKMILMK
jgi:hypothetical protein